MHLMALCGCKKCWMSCQSARGGGDGQEMTESKVATKLRSEAKMLVQERRPKLDITEDGFLHSAEGQEAVPGSRQGSHSVSRTWLCLRQLHSPSRQDGSESPASAPPPSPRSRGCVSL